MENPRKETEIKEMPNETFKKMIKESIKESPFLYLNDKRKRRNGKGIEVEYEKLEMQNYLKTLDIDITNEEMKVIFQLRNKMHF